MSTANAPSIPPEPDSRATIEILGGLLRAPYTVVWSVLIAATVVSWYFGTGHGFDSHATTTTIVMIVAFIKVRFVGLYFMELRDAPISLRSVFEGYCLVVCAVILGIYYLL